MTSAEEWREVPGLQGCFASSRGRVRKHSKLLRLYSTESGHVTCSVFGLTRKVHQLVAAAFKGVRPDKLVVMHMNHMPWDNRPTNLQYGTVGDNLRMDFAAGVRCNRGDQAPNRKLSASAINDIRASSLRNAELAVVYGVGRPTISKIRKFKTWTNVLNVADSSLVGKPTGDTQMAKAPKTMTLAEKKEALAGLKQAQKNHSENVKSINAALKEAEKALTVAKKSADAVIKEAEKEAAAKRKAADAALAAAAKSHAAAAAKAAKQQEAALKGTEKLNAQLAAIEAIPVAAPVAAPKAKAAKAVEAALV